MQSGRTDAAEYEVRLMESGDRDGFLELYRSVLGDWGDAGEEWFDWKYADNPYTDHLSITVAVRGGEVVGAKSLVGYEVARGTDRHPALQPADTVVHPDHRRRGLFSRMTELVKGVYADRDVGLFFNYPNEATLAGGLKHGWTHVGRATTRYRVQDPASFAAVDAGRLDGVVERAGRLAVAGYDAVRRRLPGPDRDLVVRRHEAVPVGPLADLYRRRPPDRLHVVRDETYLDWRFGNPRWDYAAYTVERDGDPVVGAVVGRSVVDGGPQASFTEVVPPAPTGGDRAARAALLEAVLADHPEADAVAAADDAFADRTLLRYGFLADTSPPLSWVASPSNLVAYALDDAFRGSDAPAATDDWVLGLGDRDTR